ncbi:MAG: sigma 54-interacting transcriptional regulator [Myxococcales bacterium]|nr:sigma 54-interacting transcriptional regulator [Myxococcales bacterium]
MAVLEIRIPTEAPKRVSLPLGRTVLGRHPSCDISLVVPQLSGKHIRFVHRSSGLWAEDLRSKNGSTRAGSQLAGETRLQVGDALTLGGTVEVEVVELSPGEGMRRTLREARQLVAVEHPELAQRLASLADELAAEAIVQNWVQPYVAEVSAAGSPREQLQVLVEAASEQARAEAWALSWLDGTGLSRRYTTLVHAGGAVEVEQPGALPPGLADQVMLSTTVMERVVGSGHPFWSAAANRDEEVAHAHSVVKHNLVSVGCVPLGRHAALYVTHDEPGHFDAITIDRIEALCRASAHLFRPPPADPPTSSSPLIEGMVGESRLVHELCAEARGWAPMPLNLLILGERGTGKTHLAKALHALSGRTGPFVHCDCPTHLTGELSRSALFGHVKGAFTGAMEDRTGFAEESAGGTLFLDEIGELPDEAQSRLLLLLQERTFRPVGSTRDVPFTGRIIAATNRPLDTLRDSGVMRPDLLDRLAEVQLRVPSLRERPGDIPALARHFLERESTMFFEQNLIPPREISHGAMQLLCSRPPEGNVRALRSQIVRAMGKAIRQNARTLEPHHLEADLVQAPVTVGNFKDLVEAYERQLLAHALDQTRGNQRAAAELLGLSNSAWHRVRKRTGFDV